MASAIRWTSNSRRGMPAGAVTEVREASRVPITEHAVSMSGTLSRVRSPSSRCRSIAPAASLCSSRSTAAIPAHARRAIGSERVPSSSRVILSTRWWPAAVRTGQTVDI